MDLDPNQQAEQDRRMLVAMGLTALVVFYFYAFVFEPPTPPEAPPEEPATTAVADPSTPAAIVAPAGDDDDSAGGAAAVAVTPAPLPEAPARTLEFGWSGVGATWSSLGGGPADYILDDYVAQAEKAPWLPTWLLSKVKGEDEGFTLQCAEEETHGLVDIIQHKDIAHLPVGIDGRGIASDIGNYRVVSNTVDSVVFSTVRDGIEITKSYRFPKDGYVSAYDVSFKNVTGTARELSPSFGVVDFMPEPENRYGPKVETHVQVEDDHEVADEGKVRKKNGELTFTGPMSWWGIGDKYFLLGLEPKGEMLNGTAAFTVVDEDKGIFASTVSTAPRILQPGQTADFAFKLWAGPKTLEGLEAAEMRMASSVDFGIFGLIAIPILYFLKFLYGIVGSYGIAIIVLTVTVKLLLFPLTQKQYKSMKAMQDLNPEIAEMREKYGDDREALNKEMMSLFQERGVNPMGGCLPMIVQMPIWFALYRVLWMSADLYQAQFGYFCDLTLQDPLGVFPVLMSLTMYITQKMNESPTMDASQQRIMRFMTLFFGVIMFTLPSGLVLYIFVNNILSIIQQWWIKRGFGEPTPAGSKA